MKHIFCLHSNICVIVSLDIIERLIERKEEVVILLSRNCSFNFFGDKIKIYDVHKKYEGSQLFIGSLFSISTYKQIFKYKKYLSLLKDDLSEIIGHEKFVFYTPNYATSIAPILGDSKYCEGYYFLEEGTLSYLDKRFLKKRWFSIKTKIANVIRYCFGIKSFFQLTITPKYKGTVALSPKCFPWNNKEKNVTSFDTYLTHTSKSFHPYDNILLVGYNEYNLEIVKQAIISAVQYINTTRQNKSIAIKFHPHTYAYNPAYAKLMECLVSESLKYLNITILQNSYPVEAAILNNNSTIFSLFGLSSLSFYSIMLKRNVTYDIRIAGGGTKMTKIGSIEEYMNFVYN